MGDPERHYDTMSIALAASRQMRTPLRKFHNDAKRALLDLFGRRAGRLLDLACGRGGDLHKWRAADVKKVLGLDISGASVDEARARCAAIRADLRFTFERADLTQPYVVTEPCDVVTCMFALHYFFGNERDAQTIVKTAADALKDGGYFVGIVPDASQVLERIRYGPFDNGVLRVQALWPGKPQCFGSAYTCDIDNTVTQSSTVPEYLVYDNVLCALAAQHGLDPVPIDHPMFDAAAHPGSAFHRLRPPYDGPEAACSAMYAAFVFQKKSAHTSR